MISFVRPNLFSSNDKIFIKKSSPIIVAFCNNSFKSFSSESILDSINELRVFGILYSLVISRLVSMVSLRCVSFSRNYSDLH